MVDMQSYTTTPPRLGGSAPLGSAARLDPKNQKSKHFNGFQKSEGTGHAATRNDAVLEAAKMDTSIGISKFQLFACLLKNH